MVAYSIDLNTISLEEFATTLLTVEMLPSRAVLVDHIEAILPKLAEEGVENLAGLKRLLAHKVRYPDLADELNVGVDYLTVLNRETNSYVSKSVSLSKLGCLDPEELEALDRAGIRSTKALYERCAAKSDRSEIASETGVAMDRIERALGLANLIRINGVGPAFAEWLLEAGVIGPADFLDRDLGQMVDDYAAKVGDGPKLRIEDLEFVQRYCRGMSEDIEW